MKFLAGFLLVFAFIATNAHADYQLAAKKNLVAQSVTISSGGTASAALDLAGHELVGINFPATFTGTTVTFQTSEAIGGTYQGVYNASGAVSYTVAQARYYAIDPKDFYGVRFLKVVSGSTEGADRILVLHYK